MTSDANSGSVCYFSTNELLIMNRLVRKVDPTPPTPAAIEGATRTLAFLKTSTASAVHGIMEPKNEQEYS